MLAKGLLVGWQSSNTLELTPAEMIDRVALPEPLRTALHGFRECLKLNAWVPWRAERAFAERVESDAMLADEVERLGGLVLLHAGFRSFFYAPGGPADGQALRRALSSDDLPREHPWLQQFVRRVGVNSIRRLCPRAQATTMYAEVLCAVAAQFDGRKAGELLLELAGEFASIRHDLCEHEYNSVARMDIEELDWASDGLKEEVVRVSPLVHATGEGCMPKCMEGQRRFRESVSSRPELCDEIVRFACRYRPSTDEYLSRPWMRRVHLGQLQGKPHPYLEFGSVCTLSELLRAHSTGLCRYVSRGGEARIDYVNDRPCVMPLGPAGRWQPPLDLVDALTDVGLAFKRRLLRWFAEDYPVNFGSISSTYGLCFNEGQNHAQRFEFDRLLRLNSWLQGKKTPRFTSVLMQTESNPRDVWMIPCQALQHADLIYVELIPEGKRTEPRRSPAFEQARLVAD